MKEKHSEGEVGGKKTHRPFPQLREPSTVQGWPDRAMTPPHTHTTHQCPLLVEKEEARLAKITHPGCGPSSTGSGPSIITFAETGQAAKQEKSR